MQAITSSQYVDLRYLILGFTEKGYGIYRIPGVLETWGVFNEYDRLRLLGEIILNAYSLGLSFCIDKYFEELKRYKNIKDILPYISLLKEKLKFLNKYSKYIPLISPFISPNAKLKSILDSIHPLLSIIIEKLDNFLSKNKEPKLFDYIKPYAVYVYLWLIRAGIELKKYPQTKDFNEIAIISFKRLLYHVENDIWGMEFSQGISERDLAIEALKVLFQKITSEEFLKLIYEKDTKKLAEILDLDEKIVKDTFRFWEPVPIPPGILNN